MGAQGAGKLQDRTKKIAAPVARLLWRIRTEGYDKLPGHGGAILCPNHISFLDSAFLLLTLPRRISFVGKAEYLDSWKTKYLFPAMGMIPIDRSGGEASSAALESATAVLERGELFGIFPEGTRSPIYPVGITGTADIQPPDAKVPKPFRSCAIHVGAPIDPGRYAARGDDHLVYRQLIDEVMYEIREMTGQAYRDVYATKNAEALPSAPAHISHVSEHAIAV
jgi:1-acyl-sn-glycerol-3-phosphate acyltransferase